MEWPQLPLPRIIMPIHSFSHKILHVFVFTSALLTVVVHQLWGYFYWLQAHLYFAKMVNGKFNDFLFGVGVILHHLFRECIQIVKWHINSTSICLRSIQCWVSVSFSDIKWALGNLRTTKYNFSAENLKT